MLAVMQDNELDRGASKIAASVQRHCALTRELWPLLVELTGSLVVTVLAEIPELRDSGVVPASEERS